ncbi:MAG TPA: DUF6412 domain-containing protein [Streptosporangiaceae bacterium]|nr:DUF6412 domain-containing protein [Streptosporangiaceae bacterium]
MVALLVGALTQLAGFWQAATHVATLPSASGLMALAAVALTGMLVAFLAHGGRIAAAVTARPLTGRAAALREKSWSAAFQRQRDPDAPGRARPRAPSAVPAAA